MSFKRISINIDFGEDSQKSPTPSDPLWLLLLLAVAAAFLPPDFAELIGIPPAVIIALLVRRVIGPRSAAVEAALVALVASFLSGSLMRVAVAAPGALQGGVLLLLAIVVIAVAVSGLRRR